MKIKCLNLKYKHATEQEYIIDPVMLDLCFIRDSDTKMMLKAGIDKDTKVQLALEQPDNIIGLVKAEQLYDAKFFILHTGCSFMIENIISPSKEELLDKFCIKE